MGNLRFASLVFVLISGCATHEEIASPAGIPYACDGGKTARVLYVGGGYFPRAAARLFYDGRVIDLQATPPTFGLRYVSADGAAGPIFIWSTRGEDAWLREIDGPDPNAQARVIARCTRARA